MKTHKTFTVAFRRKREGRTNYRKRLKILQSQKVRLVVRCSSRNIIAQLVEYHAKGDKVLVSAHSKDLVKLGWKANTGNLPTSYLVGLLLARKAKKKKVIDAVLDIGMQSSIAGVRSFALLKGAVDGGLKIKHSEKIFPVKERIQGKHISDYAKLIKGDDNEYKNRFAAYLKNNLNPEEIENHFELIKKKVKDNG